MHPRRRAFAFLVTAAAVAAVGNAAASAAPTSHSSSAVTPKRGGHITIARIEDSTSFDKTNVFQNESIWLTEQINESLYDDTLTPRANQITLPLLSLISDPVLRDATRSVVRQTHADTLSDRASSPLLRVHGCTADGVSTPLPTGLPPACARLRARWYAARASSSRPSLPSAIPIP